MISAAINAYNKAQTSAISATHVEKMAFERAVGLLSRAANNIRDFDSYVSALKFNQTLWTLIQAGISDGDIQLPKNIKTNLLNLGSFVDAQTFKALADPNEAYLTSLIEIDLNIVGGLFSHSDSN